MSKCHDIVKNNGLAPIALNISIARPCSSVENLANSLLLVAIFALILSAMSTIHFAQTYSEVP